MLINHYLQQGFEQMILYKLQNQLQELLPDLFSFEMWGGATFDVAYRFLKEDPWESIINIKKANSKCSVPNAYYVLQMQSVIKIIQIM